MSITIRPLVKNDWDSVSKIYSEGTPLKPNYVKDFGYKLASYAPSNWTGNIETEITDIDFLEEK